MAENEKLQHKNVSLRGTLRKRHKQHESRAGTIKSLNATILKMEARIAELEGNPLPTILDIKAAARQVDPSKVQKYRDYIEARRQKGIINALRELISEEEFLEICAKFNTMSDEELDDGWGLTK
jgi:hypothetical protein